MCNWCVSAFETPTYLPNLPPRTGTAPHTDRHHVGARLAEQNRFVLCAHICARDAHFLFHRPHTSCTTSCARAAYTRRLAEPEQDHAARCRPPAMHAHTPMLTTPGRPLAGPDWSQASYIPPLTVPVRRRMSSTGFSVSRWMVHPACLGQRGLLTGKWTHIVEDHLVLYSECNICLVLLFFVCSSANSECSGGREPRISLLTLVCIALHRRPLGIYAALYRSS